MIQRIQTAYLLVAGLLTASLYKLKFADILFNGNLYIFNARGISNGDQVSFNGLAIFIFIGIITLLHFIIIGMYKKRIRQIRITVFTIILLLGLSGMFLYYGFSTFKEAKVAFKIPVIFPLVAIILDYLAIRSIGKDEALVRSLNRIR